MKNNPKTPNAPIPPSTLQQAGTFCVASSKAWETKALMGSWWVNANQISKTTPTGEYLTTGGVFVSGTKNPLPPTQLVLGFAALFQISEDSVKNHRRLRGDENSEEENAKENIGDGDEDQTNQKSAEEEPSTPHQSSIDNEENTHMSDNLKLVGPIESDGTQSRVDVGLVQDGLLNGELSDEDKGPSSHESSPGDMDAEFDDRKATISTKSATVSAAPASNSGKSSAHVRGKRGKNKKIAEKYKWQDEEDKALALQLLGSANINESTSLPFRKNEPTQTKSEDQREAEREARIARRRAQHEKAAQAERDRLKRLHDEAQGKTESIEAADMSMLPCLVGSPKVEDELLGAFPICAPWTALTTFKYKTKIQPGPLKRGKAVKEMIGRWVSSSELAVKSANKQTKEKSNDKETQEEALDDDLTAKTQSNLAAHELELLKAWKETEGVNCVPVSNMRIVSGAGDKDSKGKGKGGSAVKKDKASKGTKNGKGSKKKKA